MFGLRRWVIAILVMWRTPPAIAARAPRETDAVRLEKRGPRAWENFMSSPITPLSKGGTTRLIVHAVADASALQWIPKVREFLQAAKRSGTDLSMPEGLDRGLAQYMDWLCYGEQRSPSIGSLLFFGILCLLPEMKGRLPLAARSLQSWTRLAVSVEGGPLPEEVIYLVAVEMLREGHLLEGCWVLCQYDTYGREQDMEQLCGCDIAWDGRTMALLLGASARGESVKTGQNQGVVVRRALVADILLALKENAGENKVFPIAQERFRRLWHRVLRRLGLGFTGPPHSIRHSGPTEDLARNRASLEAVRRRGRWKSLDSVQRYTKTFALVRFRARAPPETLHRAASVAKNLRQAVLGALQCPPARHQALAHGLARSLHQARGRDTKADMEKNKSPRRSTASTRTGPTDEDLSLSDDLGWATD